jgi:cation:H+ antiporter
MTGWFLLLLGGVLLYFGAEWLVRGAAGLALSLKIRPIIVGLTVVAYGTSAPELIVGITAALEKKGALALGNSIGSNIANLGLILGLTALVAATRVDGSLIRRELPFLFASTLAVPLLLLDGELSRVDGGIFLTLTILYTAWTVKGSVARETLEEIADVADAAGAPAVESRGMLAVTALVGLALLMGGGKLFVDGAVQVAQALGMSERLIGLTIVAVGTSVPELAASLVAAVRGHGSIAVGNVVGSNIFNVLLILGAAAAIHPIEIPLGAIRYDLYFYVGITLFGIFILRRARTIHRVEAVLLLLTYVAFIAGLIF